MVVRDFRARRRFGGTLVESAVVLTTLMSFVLGVFEYGRLMMSWNLVNNAAREGCRYALANNTSSTISTDVQTLVTGYMGGQTTSFTGFTATVSGTHLGVSTTVNNLAPGDLVTVTVSGAYQFMNIIPLIRMPTSMTITSAVTMVCEGGT
ncbi:MAG: pilus assembly protein [Isosphaeraceae bacterium]|nr:pilus assembly protein [Isosphaeraceae bacterium]